MAENFVQGFALNDARIRGRIVRMETLLDDILSPHAYPHAVLQLTGEMAVLAGLLSSMLKFDGIFTLQIQSEGTLKMLVADITSAGEIRACATFKDGGGDSPALGDGYMAFTVDQGAHTDRYQGIVALKPHSLTDSVQHYFTQSEQIATGLMVFVDQVDGAWRGAGLMLQQMPEDQQTPPKNLGDGDEDEWRRAMILMPA